MFSNQSEKQLSEIAILRIRKVFEVFFFKEKKKKMIIIMSPKRKVLSSRRLIYLVSLILTFWILLWVTWRSKREITACRNIIT